jgi:hypothetical protein
MLMLMWMVLGCRAEAHETGETHDHPVAQVGDHGHGSPHGGLAVTAGDYHVELLVDGQVYAVYLLGEDMSSLPVEGVTGQLIVTLESGAAILPLTAGPERLEALSEAAIPNEFVVVVQLTVNGESLTARFNYSAEIQPTTEEGAGTGVGTGDGTGVGMDDGTGDSEPPPEHGHGDHDH